MNNAHGASCETTEASTSLVSYPSSKLMIKQPKPASGCPSRPILSASAFAQGLSSGAARPIRRAIRAGPAKEKPFACFACEFMSPMLQAISSRVGRRRTCRNLNFRDFTVTSV